MTHYPRGRRPKQVIRQTRRVRSNYDAVTPILLGMLDDLMRRAPVAHERADLGTLPDMMAQ